MSKEKNKKNGDKNKGLCTTSEQEKPPFKYGLNEVLKTYTYTIAVFGFWFFVHGYLVSLSWHESLGVSEMSIPIDLIQTKIYGGLDIITENIWLIYLLPLPALFSLFYWFIQPRINWRIIADIKTPLFTIIVTPVLILFFLIPRLITNPIDLGEERAKYFKEKCNCDQLILGDSLLLCKIVHFEKDYAVWLVNSTTYAQELPSGSRRIYDPIFVATCEKECEKPKEEAKK